MLEAGTQRSLAHAESGGPDWRRNGTGRPGNWTTRVQRVPPEEWRVARGEWQMADAGRMTSTG